MGSVAREFAEVVKFRLGASVLASDGAAGSIAHVVVAPGTHTVSHIGVKLGHLFRHIYDLPVDVVAAARAETVEVTITRADFAPQSQNVPAGSVALSDAMVVESDGGRVGKLLQISASRETYIVERIVVERWKGGGEVIVPVDATTSIDARRIRLKLTSNDLKTLTPYRPDDVLIQDVMAALYDYPRLRIDLRAIQVRAVDGMVWLQGHVSSDLNSRIAADQIQGIAGVAEIHNQLVADTDLATAVATALARDPRTRHGQHIGVYPNLGDIYLRGAVSTPEVRAAAGEIAARVAGVAHVFNELAVRPTADVVPMLSSVTSNAEAVPGSN
jgi:osmotically-inducible protein OsmY